MTTFQQAERVDLAILDALARCNDPINFVALREHLCAHKPWVSDGTIACILRTLRDRRLVVVSYLPAAPNMPLYNATESGRSYLAASMDEIECAAAAERPTEVSVCNAAEPEESDPARAILCVDEDELDGWWNALDVEAKADAFVQWSLGNDGRNSHVYIEPNDAVRVPVRGVAGDDKERLGRRLDEAISNRGAK